MAHWHDVVHAVGVVPVPGVRAVVVMLALAPLPAFSDLGEVCD